MKAAFFFTAFLALALASSCLHQSWSGRRESEHIASTLRAFSASARAQDFAACHDLLSSRWQKNLTVTELERDFHADANAQKRAQRLELAMALNPVIRGSQARIFIDQTKTIVLRFERNRWRVDQLE